jgi:hypothetical protein
MKIIKDEIATLKRKRRITVEVDHNEFLVSIKPDLYYRLGGQVEDIVQGHVIADMSRVYWCSITQKWEEA